MLLVKNVNEDFCECVSNFVPYSRWLSKVSAQNIQISSQILSALVPLILSVLISCSPSPFLLPKENIE